MDRMLDPLPVVKIYRGMKDRQTNRKAGYTVLVGKYSTKIYMDGQIE